jgi:hypothetical protein
MSTDLYLTGLWWDGQKGWAKHDGVDVRLARAPVLGRLVVDRMEFNPAVSVCWIAERACDSRRDMSPDEREDAALWLLRMSSAVRQVVG